MPDIIHSTLNVQTVGQDFKQYSNGYSPRVITENEDKDKLSELYFTADAKMQQRSKQERYILRSAQDVEKFLQKATGGKVTLADITVENGRMKGLPGNLDLLLNNPGKNQTYTDYREDILAIKNFEKIWGSGLLEEFTAGYLISGNDILIK